MRETSFALFALPSPLRALLFLKAGDLGLQSGDGGIPLGDLLRLGLPESAQFPGEALDLGLSFFYLPAPYVYFPPPQVRFAALVGDLRFELLSLFDAAFIARFFPAVPQGECSCDQAGGGADDRAP